MNLKIDKSFVDAMDVAAHGDAFVNAILDLARTLGLDTIAEGVEAAEQETALRSLGCGSAQGFLFAEPLDAADADALLHIRPSQARLEEGPTLVAGDVRALN